MGLDFKDINLSEPLLSWYLSGIKYLIKDNPPIQDYKHLNSSSNAIYSNKEILFPEPWDRIFKHLNPPHPHIWTYWELAEDMTSSFSKSRQTLFNNIVKAMQWPKNSIVFWPLSYLDTNTIYLRSDIFWKGLKLIQPKYIVCFGRRAFINLFPSFPLKYGKITYKNYHVIYLPGPEKMLPDNRQVKKIVWNLLKSLHAQ